MLPNKGRQGREELLLSEAAGRTAGNEKRYCVLVKKGDRLARDSES